MFCRNCQLKICVQPNAVTHCFLFLHYLVNVDEELRCFLLLVDHLERLDVDRNSLLEAELRQKSLGRYIVYDLHDVAAQLPLILRICQYGLQFGKP